MENLRYLKKYGFYFLLIAVIADFLTPYVLGIFYPKLNQLIAVISLFGDIDSPVRSAFLIWSVVAGSFYTLSLPAIYAALKETSKGLASLATAAIGLYGIGDCIFTGLFSVDSVEVQWDFSTWVHNIGSGIGYTPYESRRYLKLFVLSVTIASMYGLARIPQLNQFIIFQQLGFWQRLSFVFNYLPIVLFTWSQIKNPVNR